MKHTKLTFCLELLNKFWNRAHTNGVEKLFDVNFITVKFKESTKYLWSCILIDLEKIDLNELVLSIVVEVSGQLISEVVHITEVDKWSWIWKFGIFEEIFDLDWVIV